MSRSLLDLMQPQYYMPREQDRAGNFPQGYFGQKLPSGTPYPDTMYMEMVRQTENAQRAPDLGRLPVNAAAWDALLARAPRSTNIEDRRGEIQPDTSQPLPNEAYASAPTDSTTDPLAQALGYGSLAGYGAPLPRPRPRR